jgi:hypothetical protein
LLEQHAIHRRFILRVLGHTPAKPPQAAISSVLQGAREVPITAFVVERGSARRDAAFGLIQVIDLLVIESAIGEAVGRGLVAAELRPHCVIDQFGQVVRDLDIGAETKEYIAGRVLSELCGRLRAGDVWVARRPAWLRSRCPGSEPRIRVTDLLSEVAGWTLFTDCFTHLRSGRAYTPKG